MLCHECGDRFAALGQHVSRAHGIKADSYRERHGLEGSLRIRSATARRRPHLCSSCDTILITAAKLCDACKAHRQETVDQQRMRRPRWRQLSVHEEARLVNVHAEELAQLVRQLQRERVPSNVIGSVLGISPAQMSQRFPRREYRRSQSDQR
ncbi:MucR family transcriptional regulator [Tessaracoccus sp. MC1756]|nr:MucR family transcriptional regulator [Tessaracoccus sp. MC1756]